MQTTLGGQGGTGWCPDLAPIRRIGHLRGRRRSQGGRGRRGLTTARGDLLHRIGLCQVHAIGHQLAASHGQSGLGTRVEVIGAPTPGGPVHGTGCRARRPGMAGSCRRGGGSGHRAPCQRWRPGQEGLMGGGNSHGRRTKRATKRQTTRALIRAIRTALAAPGTAPQSGHNARPAGLCWQAG